MSDRSNSSSPDRPESAHRGLAFWMERLNSLVDGEDASRQLVFLGSPAVTALRDFLLFGKPAGIYQPRKWAVEALADLGARDVLLEYLTYDPSISDPVIREGEDAVRNTAARLVVRWRDAEVFRTLYALGEKHSLPGVIFALGEFQRPEALPILDRALEDDIARPSAEEAFTKWGTAAAETLVSSALRVRSNHSVEAPSSLRRRRAALKILADTALGCSFWPQLRELLQEHDAELVVHAARIAVTAGPEPDKRAAVEGLLRVLPDAPWYLREDLATSLAALYPLGQDRIEGEIAVRATQPPLKQAVDGTLLFLRRVQARVHHDLRSTGPG